MPSRSSEVTMIWRMCGQPRQFKHPRILPVTLKCIIDAENNIGEIKNNHCSYEVSQLKLLVIVAGYTIFL
jgi:hypothetical protein